MVLMARENPFSKSHKQKKDRRRTEERNKIKDLHHELVGGNADVEGVGGVPAHSLGFPLLDGAVVSEDLERRTPLHALDLPVQQHSGGDHNQVRAPDPSVSSEMRQQG